ncbi:MAG: oligosaccharide flippase family protein [Candidatus Marinimicrobia bacterium]|nr:oligosaccharide flippase family protein [Candidatus Neomarinimicrobiota bacterium]
MPIRPQVKQLGTNSAIYGLGNLLNKLAAFLLIPVYTKNISISDVGIFALFEMMEIILLTLAPLGIMRAMWRFFPDKTYSQKTIFSSAYTGIILINIVALAAIGSFYKQIGILFGLEINQMIMVLVILLNIILALSTNFLLSIWQYHQKASQYIILTVLQFISILILSSFFVIYYDMGLWGLLLGKTFVLGIIFIFSLFLITKKYMVMPSYVLWTKLLKYGAPFIFLSLVAPILTLSSRLFLRLFMSLDDIAVYFIAFKFGMLINMFLVVPLQRGLIPMIYSAGIEQKSKIIYQDMLFYYSIIGSIMFLGISLLTKPILGIITNPNYLIGAGLIPIVAFAYYLAGFQHFFTASAAIHNKTGRIAIASIFTILTNFGLNLILIKNYGINGAAWATLISYFILSLSIYVISYRLEQFDWGFKRLIKVISITLIIYICTTILNEIYQNLNILISLLSIIIFIVILKITQILGDREINGIKSIISKLGEISKRK